jgi:glycosyltransferase involved in cell wall biosynthesis
MKVAFVVESFARESEMSGGVRVCVRKQADFLSRRHRIVAIAPRMVFLPLRRYAPMKESQGAKKGFCSSEGDVKVYRPACVHVPVLWVLLEPLQLVFWIVVVCALLERGVSLIHAHRCYPAGYASSLAARILRLPMLLTVYGSDVNAGLNPAAVGARVSLASAYSLRHASAVIAVSRALAERVRLEGVPADRVIVITSGVDAAEMDSVSQEQARTRLGLPKNARVILFAANLVPVKDPLTMLEAFSLLKKEQDGVVLAVLGTGDLKAAVEARSTELGLSDSVMLLGQRPRGEVPLWLAASDVVALSSIDEGCPVITLEAFVAGKPFVGTSVGGLPEIVPESAGILVEPRNPEALAGALTLALKTAWDARELKTHAMKFSWEALVARIEEAYERTAARKVPAVPSK